MVRETRHLWVGNLPDNIREDRIREHFKRYGRVQSVKLLPRSTKEDTGENTMACTVAFMDIKSASKARDAEHKIDDRTLTTEYYEPVAIPSAASPQNAPSSYSTSPGSNRFPNGHGPTEEHSNFSDRFYDRTGAGVGVIGRVPDPEYRAIRNSTAYHENNNRGRNRDRTYRTNGPYNNIVDRTSSHRINATSWQTTSTYDTTTAASTVNTTVSGAATRYNNTNSDTGYSTTPSEPNERRNDVPVKKKTKSRSGSRSPSPSGTNSSRSVSRSRSRSSSSSSSSGTSRDTSTTSSPRSRKDRNHQEDRRPLAICVKNLPCRSSDTSLKDGLFHEYKKHGKVTSVKVVGQSSERHAIVCFKKPEDVEKALEVSYDKLFFGSKIEVAPYQGHEVDDTDSRLFEADIDEFNPKATRTLFIGNLEKDVTASDLRKHFDQFGEIIEIDIKKQGAVSSYAFCQYSDIMSVVKAIRALDGEHLGNNRIKLGFGKSMPTSCVWIDGITETISEKYLINQFETFGAIQQVIIDREKGQGLVFFEQVVQAQAAVNKMRGVTLGRSRKLQIDFASRECQDAFYDHLEKQGHVTDRVTFEERIPRDNTTNTSRFSSRYETPTRPRTASYSSRSNSTTTQLNSTSAPSPSATPGSVTPRGSRSSRVPRHPADYYDQSNFRSYDEYSQGSGASHDEPYDHDFYHESPSSHAEPSERLPSSAVNDHPVTFPAPDIRNLQKERVHILEQLDDCSSGDEVVSPKKKIKLDHLDGGLSCDVIIEANRDHRKVMEVRRLSDASAKHHRRPSIDSKHRGELTGHDRNNPYLPHAICKRRKTAGSDNGSRSHHYDQSGSESVGGSRPGTPLCDEKPEHVPSEPRRTPRDREGPLTLPLPRFAAQVLHKGSISVAGIKGQKDCVLSSPPAAVTSPRIANPKPPSPVHVPPPASPPPRPPSLSSSSSDSDGAPPSPSLDERIRSLDEKYEKWSGSRALSAAGGDALAKLDANRDKFKIRHKLLDLNVLTLKDLQPSEIVKSVLAKRSVFDEDSKRLENLGEKYEPKEFCLFPKTANLPQPVPVIPTSSTAMSSLLKISTAVTQLPKTPTVLSPRSTSTGITPAKGLQYPFPSHPPIQATTGTSSAPSTPLQMPTTPPTPSVATSTTTCPAVTPAAPRTPNSSDNRLNLKVCTSSDDGRTQIINKVTTISATSCVNRTTTTTTTIAVATTTTTNSNNSKNCGGSDTKVSIPLLRDDEKITKKSRRNSVVGGDSCTSAAAANATKSRRNSECGKVENCDSADKGSTEERDERIQREKEERLQKEKEERLQREKEERLQREKEERLEKERLQKEERLQREKEERLQREREERLQREKEERLQREREEKLQKEKEERLEKERLQKEKEERLQREREERLQKEKEERLQREREERLQKEREERLQKEREERLQKEKEERLQREREERLQREKEERLQREKEDRLQKEKEEKERKDKEEKDRQEQQEREKQEKEESERLLQREKERRREKEDRHKEDNHDGKHRHRENHNENNKKDHQDIRKDHDSRNHESREQKKHHSSSDSRDSDRRKENTKENRENNSYDSSKSKNNNEIKDRPSLETRHLSIDLDKNRQGESKGDPSRRKERNNSLPGHIGSKRRMSGHEEETEAKKIKLEHKKIQERRNSKDGSSRDEKNKKYMKSKSHEHKHNNEKRKDKDRSERKSEKIKSSSKSKEKSREKESPSTTPTTPGKDMALEKDFLSRLELSESEKHKKEKKDREKRKFEDERSHEDRAKFASSIERKREEMKQLKKERIRKLTTTNSSENSDSDEPKKHSIFDIVDDEPAYISMYDKVKARSCKNMQKQEEEKRQEKIKAKFSQLKQSRAKREEKKRSTSWDEDSDSDHNDSEQTQNKETKRKAKILIQSSDDDEGKPRKYSDSDSERNNHNKNFDTSDDDHVKSLQRKGSKSRITSDTSDDDFNKTVIKNEIFTDNEDNYNNDYSLFKEYPKKDAKKKLQDDISVQIFGEASSADESLDHNKEIRKKHKKKQKKKSSISDDSTKDEETLKKKQHSKKDKKRDKSKDEKSKKSKRVKESKRDGKMENIFGSLSDDSETGSKDQNEHKYNMGITEDLAGYLSDSEGAPAVKPDEKERALKEEHRKRKEKKRREKERQRRRDEVANENSVDFSDLGKQLEANIKDDSNEMPEIKEPVIKTEAVFDEEEFKKEERVKDKEKKKKRKRSKDEKNRHHHHHHHHHDKPKIKEEDQNTLPNLEVKIESESNLPNILDIPSPPLTKSSPSLDTPLSPPTTSPTTISLATVSPTSVNQKTVTPTSIVPTDLVKTTPTKEKKKFIPGFGLEIDEAIHANAVKSISEFEHPKLEAETRKPEDIKEEKVEPTEEKPRVVISQEETEDAVAALLGESFGSAQFEDYSEQPISPINPPIIAEEVQDDEEMRQAVQSLNSTELDIKPETPQSENDLQIDTDTEDQEDISLRFDQPPKTPDAADLAQPPKTPDIPNYYKADCQKVKLSIGSPPSLTPIKPPEIVKKSLELPKEEKPMVKLEPKVEKMASMPLLKTEVVDMPDVLPSNIPANVPASIPQKLEQKPPNISGHNIPSHIPAFVSQKPAPQEFVLSPKNMNRLPITTGCVTKPLQPATLVLPQAKMADPVNYVEKPRYPAQTTARHHLGFIPNPSVSRSPSLFTSYQLSMQGTIEKPKESSSSTQYRSQTQPVQIEASVNISLTDLSVSTPQILTTPTQFDQNSPSIIVSSQGKSNISISNISVNEVPAKPYMPVIQETPKVSVSSEVRSPTIIQQAPPKISLNVDVPKVEVKEGLLKVDNMRTSTPSPVIVVNKDVKAEVKEEIVTSQIGPSQVIPSQVIPSHVMPSKVLPQVLPAAIPAVVPQVIPSVVPKVVPAVPPKVVSPPVVPQMVPAVLPMQLAIEKVTEELNLSLEKEAKDVKLEYEVVKPNGEEESSKDLVENIPKDDAGITKPKDELPVKEEIKPLEGSKTEDTISKRPPEEAIAKRPPEDPISVIKEIEKINEEKADTDSVVSDISKERLSAEILSAKDDPLDSKEDSDYWSAKEVNIDSVIKKVDALCSADELSDRSSEISKEDWFDDAKKDEKPQETIEEKPVSRRGGRGRGGRKTRGAERGGVQTRRGKTTKEVVTTRRGAPRGRGGRSERKIAKTEDADIYEFKDDSDDAKDKSRFILTIHKPTFSANGNVQQPTAIVREVPKSPMKPAEAKSEVKPEEFASPVSNTRKSKRLQEKDITKNNVDDTIEDVIKNTPSRGGRRSQRATAVAKVPETPRKSPRARKNDRRPSDTTDDEEKNKPTKPEAPQEVVPPKEAKVENGEPPKPKEKPHEGLKAAVLRRVKDEMNLEPMTLIDPVTGHLTPMRECEEGKYIPVSAQQKNLTTLAANAAQQPAQASVVVKQKPQSLKAHVLSFQNANKTQSPVVTSAAQPQKPVVTSPVTFVPRSSPLPVMQNLNVNVAVPSYVPPHLSPRPSSKPVPSQLSPNIKPQPPSKTVILNPIIQPPVNTQIAHAQPSVVKQPIMKQVPMQPKVMVQQPKPQIQQQQQQHPLGLSSKIIVKQQQVQQAQQQHGIPQGLVQQGFPGNRIVVQQQAKELKDLGPAVPKLNNVPQQRHVLPTGMPIPAYDASLGEGMAAHFPPGSIQMRSHDLPPHYMHAPHMMYQQLMRQQFIARSPMVPMEKRDGDGQEGEEAPVTSPPLELRRPGSVGLVLNRTSTVPHSLQSPKDRTTDSPQVYGMHTARMQHYHPVSRIFDHEPPPAHRAVASTLPPIANEQRPYGMGGAPVGIVRPDRPLSNDRFTPLGQPDRPLSTHSMTMERPLPYNLPTERNLNMAAQNQNLMNPGGGQIPKDIVVPLTNAIVGGISVCVADALARQLDQGGPPGPRTVPTSPNMQPAVPSKGNLYQLLQRQHFPIMWQGLLALKTDQAAVQMYYVSGNDEVAKMSLPKNIDGTTPPLRIFQRMRLEHPQLDGVIRKMQAEKEHCMLLALPCGKDHDDALEQHTNMSNGLISYLSQKQAAGIINIAAPGTTTPPAYVVHIFPTCDFVSEHLGREAPDLLRSLGDLAHLLIVITTV